MLNEADTRAKLIDPQLRTAGWNKVDIKREHYLISPGQIVIMGDEIKRKPPKWADYALFYQNSIPIAVVEAKDENHQHAAGLQKAKTYAGLLDVKFAYATNGHLIEEFDFITNHQTTLNKFPTPGELYSRYQNFLKYKEKIKLEKKNPLTYPFYSSPREKRPVIINTWLLRELLKLFFVIRKEFF